MVMAKTFRDWAVDQRWLLPPSVDEFVPAGHMAHFVRDTVREALDLSAIVAVYTEERGYSPGHDGGAAAVWLQPASTRRGNWRGPAKSGWTSWR